MSIMISLSIENTKKKCFVCVGGVNCSGVVVRLSPYITGCRLDRWEGLMEYMVWVIGNS